MNEFEFQVSVISILKGTRRMDGSKICSVHDSIETNDFDELNEFLLQYEDEGMLCNSPYEFRFFDSETGERVFVNEQNHELDHWSDETYDFDTDEYREYINH